MKPPTAVTRAWGWLNATLPRKVVAGLVLAGLIGGTIVVAGGEDLSDETAAGPGPSTTALPVRVDPETLPTTPLPTTATTVAPTTTAPPTTLPPPPPAELQFLPEDIETKIFIWMVTVQKGEVVEVDF